MEPSRNSRPLVPLSSNPNDFEALRPGHFLVQRLLITIPEVGRTQRSLYVRWQQLKPIHQTYRQRWTRGYLHHLQANKILKSARTGWHLQGKGTLNCDLCTSQHVRHNGNAIREAHQAIFADAIALRGTSDSLYINTIERPSKQSEELRHIAVIIN